MPIECQIYYVNECGTECEIVHQSKRRFECVIKCGTECEIVHQSEYEYEGICNWMPNLLCKLIGNRM